MSTVNINGQNYIIEVGEGGYSYYRIPSNQRFGKSVKAKGTSLLVSNANDGTPNADIGLGVLDWGTGSVYPTTIPWDISSLVYNTSFSISAYQSTVSGVVFSEDGLNMFIIGTVGDTIRSFSLSTAWDISSATIVGSHSFTSAYVRDATGIHFSPDGLNAYITCNFHDQVVRLELSTPWDISSISYNDTFDLTSETAFPYGITLNPTGTKMYVVGRYSSEFIEYDLSTPWDINTASHAASQVLVGSGWEYSFSISSDGLQIMTSDELDNDIQLYDLSIPWEVTSAVLSDTFSYASQGTSAAGVFSNADSSRVYVSDHGSDEIHEYIMN